MTNPSKRKGSAFEVAVRDWFLDKSITVRRNPTNGAFDIGDLAVEIDGIHYVVEAKATKQIDLPGFLAEADTEASNYAKLNRLPWSNVRPLVVVKRRQHGVDRAYAVQELGWWLADHD
jgi:hypothetical protein